MRVRLWIDGEEVKWLLPDSVKIAFGAKINDDSGAATEHLRHLGVSVKRLADADSSNTVWELIANDQASIKANRRGEVRFYDEAIPDTAYRTVTFSEGAIVEHAFEGEMVGGTRRLVEVFRVLCGTVSVGNAIMTQPRWPGR